MDARESTKLYNSCTAGLMTFKRAHTLMCNPISRIGPIGLNILLSRGFLTWFLRF